MEKHLIILPLICIFCGCNGQGVPSITTDSSRTIQQAPGNISNPLSIPEDPYFVLTRDTFSASGPKDITRNVLEDRDGNIWLSTWEGIIRYDGKRFTNYTLKEGLRQFHVFSILEDRGGHIWFGTIRGGLYRYDPTADPSSRQFDPSKTGSNPFTLFTTAEGLANDMILCMMQDRDGLIWIGTDDGVSRYDPSKRHTHGSKVFTNFTAADGLCGNSINSIVQDAQGRIWFGTRGGERGDCCYYDGKSYTLVSNAIGARFSNVRMILEDQQGIIWIGGEDGLYRYEPFASNATGGSLMTAITKDFIGYIFEDKAGSLWLSQGHGNRFSLHRYDGKTSVSIASRDMIFGITEDRNGNIWFGTTQGVVRYDGASFEAFAD
jgi:streptogramin lyase